MKNIYDLLINWVILYHIDTYVFVKHGIPSIIGYFIPVLTVIR